MKIHNICLDNTCYRSCCELFIHVYDPFLMESSDLVMFHQKCHNSVFWWKLQPSFWWHMQNLANHLVLLLQVCIHFEYNAHMSKSNQQLIDMLKSLPYNFFFFFDNLSSQYGGGENLSLLRFHHDINHANSLVVLPSSPRTLCNPITTG